MSVRRPLAAILLLAGAIYACTEQESTVEPKRVGSPRFGIVSPPYLGLTTLPIDSIHNPHTVMSLPTYSTSTIVEVRLNGSLRVTSDTSTVVDRYNGLLDGSGVFVLGAWYACYVNVTFSWPASQASGPGPCLSSIDSTRLNGAWADTILASGQGTVTRGPGIPQWTGDCHNTPCHTYIDNTQQVSVTPLPASLGLGLNPDSIILGSQVSFYAGNNPLYFKNIYVPLTILSWQWIPDGGGSGQTVACAQPVNPCSAVIKEAGSMQVTALVNGAEQSKSVSVGIWPLAAPCPAAVLTNHPTMTTQYGAVDPSHGDPHTGRDFGENYNTPVQSARDGIVVDTTNSQSTGKRIIVRSTDGSGRLSYYYHLQSRSAHMGQTVHAGDVIGATGNTGISTGPHLHFEEHIDLGPFYDPVTGKTNRRNLAQPCTF